MDRFENHVLKASAATVVRFFLGVFPVRHQGSLILSHDRLYFDRATDPPLVTSWADRPISFNRDSILDVRSELWPLTFREALAWFFAPWYAFTRERLGANLTVATEAVNYHFRVRDPDGWSKTLLTWLDKR